MPITHTLLSSYNTNHNVNVCSKNLIRLHIADLMPHFFLNRKESQLRYSEHIKKIAFPSAQGCYIAVISV